MGRLAERVMKFLLQFAPWYHPADVEKREQRVATVARRSALIRSEAFKAEERLR